MIYKAPKSQKKSGRKHFGKDKDLFLSYITKKLCCCNLHLLLSKIDSVHLFALQRALSVGSKTEMLGQILQPRQRRSETGLGIRPRGLRPKDRAKLQDVVNSVADNEQYRMWRCAVVTGQMWNAETGRERKDDSSSLYADLCCLSLDGQYVGVLRKHENGTCRFR